MHRTPRKKKSNSGGPTAKPDRRDDLVLGAIVGGICLLGILLFLLYVPFKARQALRERLESWRTEYHLSDEQIERIRQIEVEFHGSGSVFGRPIRSVEEARLHELAISGEMSPEQGSRFLDFNRRKASAALNH